jgi:hypothetical protein
MSDQMWPWVYVVMVIIGIGASIYSVNMGLNFIQGEYPEGLNQFLAIIATAATGFLGVIMALGGFIQIVAGPIWVRGD